MLHEVIYIWRNYYHTDLQDFLHEMVTQHGRTNNLSHQLYPGERYKVTIMQQYSRCV
jgi:hypothetical protein